jgi:hypothetical protein
VIVSFFNERPFISRSNNRNSDFFDGVSNHRQRLSKVVSGLNKYVGEANIVDISSYNLPSDFDEFFAAIDDKYSLIEGTLKKGNIEIESLETSAQAVCRLGLRLMGDAKHEEYIIVIPDQRTENYLKNFYFPHASYMGAIVTDEVREKVGRKSGGSNKGTLSKVAKAKLLVDAGMSIVKACDEAGITRNTYKKYLSAVSLNT